MKNVIIAQLLICGAMLCACSDNDDDNTHDNGYSYDVSNNPQMVDVPAATISGSFSESAFIAGRTVELSAFEISKYLVTQELYATILSYDDDANVAPSEYGEGSTIKEGELQNLRPVEMVSWYDAVYFCNMLSKLNSLDEVYTITDIERNDNKSIINATVFADYTLNGYRLPTEAEWEFAARGGNPSAQCWSWYYAGADSEIGGEAIDASLDPVGWYNCNGATGLTTDNTVKYGTHQVGLKQPNNLGLYDMSGNLWEWCYDWKEDITASSETNPLGAAEGTVKVLRGGSWNHGWAVYCGVGVRHSSAPEKTCNYYGFRVAKNI